MVARNGRWNWLLHTIWLLLLFFLSAVCHSLFLLNWRADCFSIFTRSVFLIESADNAGELPASLAVCWCEYHTKGPEYTLRRTEECHAEIVSGATLRPELVVVDSTRVA